MSKKNKKHFNGIWDTLFEDWDDGTIFEPKKKKGKKRHFADEEVHVNADETKIKGDEKKKEKKEKEEAKAPSVIYKIDKELTILSSYPQQVEIDSRVNPNPDVDFICAAKYGKADGQKEINANHYIDLAYHYIKAVTHESSDEEDAKKDLIKFIGNSQYEMYFEDPVSKIHANLKALAEKKEKIEEAKKLLDQEK